VKRGIIWGLFGSDEQRRVRIEYDMPILKGVPVRFDVTVTNRLDTTLTLLRFSLSPGYSNYGRDAGTPSQPLVLPKDEIAGLDLKQFVLEPAQSHKISLITTFPEAGTRWVYFNVLITGTTQNWDTQSAHEVTVQD